MCCGSLDGGGDNHVLNNFNGIFLLYCGFGIIVVVLVVIIDPHHTCMSNSSQLSLCQ